MNKKAIRIQMKSLKANLARNEIEDCSLNIFHKLIEEIAFEAYDAVYTYVAFNEEIQTRLIIEYALQKKLKVAVPKIIKKEMEFYYINGFDDLTPGFYGILEPIANEKAKDNHILMIMPGLAFDLEGNRIGYGAGYYDRYLKEKEPTLINKIAFAYDFQILENLDVEEHDIKVDQILTPTRCIQRRRN